MVMEFCADDLAALLDDMKRPFPEPMVKFIMKQLLQALSYLHLNFIVHRDVKLSNLLLSSNGMVKLGELHPNMPDSLIRCLGHTADAILCSCT
jgi:serine/threonine protein kinase